MEEDYKTHDEYLRELPDWIVEKSVEYLKSIFTETTKNDIFMYHRRDPKTWWASSHFGWGMRIRNLLRDNVCTDEKLPSGNWDDYYIQVVEIACGLRERQ